MRVLRKTRLTTEKDCQASAGRCNIRGMNGYADPDEPTYDELMEEARTMLAAGEFSAAFSQAWHASLIEPFDPVSSRSDGGSRQAGGTGHRRARRQTRSHQPARAGAPAQFLSHASPSAEPGRRHGRLGGCVERGHQAAKGGGQIEGVIKTAPGTPPNDYLKH